MADCPSFLPETETSKPAIRHSRKWENCSWISSFVTLLIWQSIIPHLCWHTQTHHSIPLGPDVPEFGAPGARLPGTAAALPRMACTRRRAVLDSISLALVSLRFARSLVGTPWAASCPLPHTWHPHRKARPQVPWLEGWEEMKLSFSSLFLHKSKLPAKTIC